MDDCADKTGWQQEQHTKVRTVEKSINGQSSFYNLSIRLGGVKLLAADGFYGCDDHPEVTGFLGSSITGLLVARRQPMSRSVFSSASSQRQYPHPTAIDSMQKRPHRDGRATVGALRVVTHSYPINPLQFADHPMTANSRDGVASQLGSFYLRCVIGRRVLQDDMEIMMAVALKDMRVEAATRTMKQHTFGMLAKKIAGSNDISAFMKTPVAALELLERGSKDGGNLRDMSGLGKIVLKILNDGLAERIADANIAAAKLYQKRYQSHTKAITAMNKQPFVICIYSVDLCPLFLHAPPCSISISLIRH